MTTPVYDDQNIFAKILRGDMPCVKVYEDDDTLVMMDIFPRSQGHCLVLPKAPARNIFDIETPMLEAVIRTTQKIAIAARAAFGADGISIAQSNEAAGNQEVFHLHVHIIPRFEGVSMARPAANMEDGDVLKANAEKIKQALAQ